MKNYPEHEKLRLVKEESQFLGSFIDWMGSNGYVIAEYDIKDRLYPANRTINQLLAEFKNIDLIKLEEEKREMFAEIIKEENVTPINIFK